MRKVPACPCRWIYVPNADVFDIYDDSTTTATAVKDSVISLLKFKKLYDIPVVTGGKIIYAAKWYGSGISVDDVVDPVYHNGIEVEDHLDPECDLVHYRLIVSVTNNYYAYAFIYFDAVTTVNGIGDVLFVRNF